MVHKISELDISANIRGRRGIADELEIPIAGFFTPLVLILIPLTGTPLPAPMPIGKPSRAPDAS